ncbi:MAG: M16 family metallopeptidase [Saprospiraceae bacterium]
MPSSAFPKISRLPKRPPPAIHPVGHLTLPLPVELRLDNGLRVFVMHFPGQEILKVEAVFHAGRPEETKRLVSRATARLVREGTGSRTGADIAEHIDFYGGTLSIPTSLDTAAFSLFSLRKYADELIPVFAEVLHEPSFPTDEIETYRRNSLQELLLDLDKEEVLAYRKVTELIFGEAHPYGYNSTPADYAALSRDDLMAFFDRWYVPANCRLFVSGHVDEAVLGLLNRHFGQTPKTGDTPLPNLQSISLEQPQTVHIPHPGSLQTAVKIGRRLFARNHPDYDGVFVLNTILGGYFGSRLMTNLREKRGFTYNIYSTADTMLHDGCLYIATEVHTGKVAETLKLIFAEMKNLCDQPVPDSELEMVRNYLLGMLLNGLDGPLNISDMVRTLLTEGLNLEAFDKLVSTVRAITPEQVQDLARRYLRPEDFWVVTVG